MCAHVHILRAHRGTYSHASTLAYVQHRCALQSIAAVTGPRGGAPALPCWQVRASFSGFLGDSHPTSSPSLNQCWLCIELALTVPSLGSTSVSLPPPPSWLLLPVCHGLRDQSMVSTLELVSELSFLESCLCLGTSGPVSQGLRLPLFVALGCHTRTLPWPVRCPRYPVHLTVTSPDPSRTHLSQGGHRDALYLP